MSNTTRRDTTPTLVSAPWGFRDPARTTADILTALQGGWDIHVVGQWGGAVLVERRSGTHNKVWFLNDNGGEINLAPVNDEAPDRNVPVTAWRRPLHAATIAYRIAMTIQGQPVDYDYELTDEDFAILRGLVRENPMLRAAQQLCDSFSGSR